MSVLQALILAFLSLFSQIVIIVFPHAYNRLTRINYATTHARTMAVVIMCTKLASTTAIVPPTSMAPIAK